MTCILNEESEAGREELRNEIADIQDGFEREGDISLKEKYR